MAEPNCREMDVARSLVDISHPQEGNQGQTQNQNANPTLTAPTQGQSFRGQPGRARAARNQAARRRRRAATAPTAPEEARVRGNTGRYGRRLHGHARPIGVFPAVRPPHAQHQPQAHNPVQGPTVNTEYTLQGHLIRQQLLAGILPEDVVTIGGRGPGVANENSNVQRNGMPAMLQITNEGVFAPPLPPATFIPPVPYQVPHGCENHEDQPPMHRWAGPQQQNYQVPAPRHPATAMGPMPFERRASGFAANQGKSAAGVPSTPLLVHQEPKKEEYPFADQSTGIPEGIPAYQRPTRERPASALDADARMIPQTVLRGGQYLTFEQPPAAARPLQQGTDPFHLYRVHSQVTGHLNENENNRAVNPTVLGYHPEHRLPSAVRAATTFQTSATGYASDQPIGYRNHGSPSHSSPLDLGSYGQAPMVQGYGRPASVLNSNHEHNLAHDLENKEGDHVESFLEALNSDDFDTSVFIKDISDVEQTTSVSDPLQGQKPDEATHSFNQPLSAKDEPDAENPISDSNPALAGDVAGYASANHEAVGQTQDRLHHHRHLVNSTVNHHPLVQQGPPIISAEGPSAAPRLGEVGWYPALYRHVGFTAVDAGPNDPAAHRNGNAPWAHFQEVNLHQPMHNRPIFPVTAPVPHNGGSWIKQDPMLGFQTEHVATPIPARPGVNILHNLLSHQEIAVNLTSYMLVQDLINLQLTSRKCRDFVVKYLPMIVRLQAKTKFRLGSCIFPWRCYTKLWLIRAVIGHEFVPVTANTPRNSLIAYTASFRWLQMVQYRERIVRSILVALERLGCGFPRRYCPAIFKLWFLMDIPDSPRRLWTVQNPNIWTDLDLFMAVFFITRIDMFVKLYRKSTTGGQRRLIMAQPSLKFCRDVLTGRALRTNMEILNALIRWRYKPRPGEVIGEGLFGVPAAEVGSLQYEGYRKRPGQNTRLQRPDELLLRETQRRHLNVQDMYRRIFMHAQPQRFTACERPNILWDEEVKLATRNTNVPAREHLKLD
ncbi:hypothetical protein BDV18DRAFT_161309 [Aspergillus unguis]